MDTTASDLITTCGGEGLTLATAESLTGGLLAAAITGVPGSSTAYGGGIVSYATSVKTDVLGVPESVVEEHGVVSAECAIAMAEAACTLFGTDLALSTTGVAGPDRQEGKPVGTVFIGVAGPDGSTAIPLDLTGDRITIQQEVVRIALETGVSAVEGRLSGTTQVRSGSGRG